ncbi:response regulator [Rhodocaloribacter litoris]|uniref:response regulator n=1 Tax=Rhodocaloribacter litoris TaxID=2558931 RepID=UPI0014243E95|nr:response regulator [Rhodocaloribacter litoris]QXD14915.1 response regulator [Rhodocaloribacter litoris]GIV58988.1 MAG: hypothetical protein KatS3mg043_0077 [Rhodothermaceae bacterium]
MQQKEEVLLVEDERAWQRELKRILEEGGYAVRVVDNYEDAVRVLKEHAVKVAVVDVSLNPGDAYDRQGLAVMAEAGLPVVCVSGYLGEEEVKALLRDGKAEWFFAKQSFAGKEKRFLDAVGYSLVVARHEISERWRIIEHHLLARGD